ncbi:hypothetical protein TCAL_15128 [Tigriopus californicus]|uniref:Uncharacterized protein n=1 Tax=Tigriopus californicus TaxID=6832 RepID=A0A553NTS6_TIGCA|nr:hypothetical protein TCAL_15128 [Tigriopus californicus]
MTGEGRSDGKGGKVCQVETRSDLRSSLKGRSGFGVRQLSELSSPSSSPTTSISSRSSECFFIHSARSVAKSISTPLAASFFCCFSNCRINFRSFRCCSRRSSSVWVRGSPEQNERVKFRGIQTSQLLQNKYCMRAAQTSIPHLSFS